MLGARGDGTDVSEIADATVTYPTLGTVLNGRKRLRTSDDFTYVASTGTLTVPIINAGTHGAITCTTLHATGAATLDSTLDVSGTTTITDTLTVQGAYATALGGTLGVAGNTTLSGTLGVVGAGWFTQTLGVTGATTITGQLNAAGGKFSGNVGVGGSSTNAFPVDMGDSSTVQKLALYNNSSVFYGFGVGNNCITATAGAASGSTTIGGLIFTSNNQLGINTGSNTGDIGYNLLVAGTAGVSGATTLTGAVTCGSTVTCTGAVTGPTYATNYSSTPTFTSSQIGYNNYVTGFSTFTGGSYTNIATLTGVPKGCLLISFLCSFQAGSTANSGNIGFRIEIQTSGGANVVYYAAWIRNYNVIDYLATDSVTGVWTYNNNTASAKIILAAYTTGTGTITPDEGSILQVTKIA